MVGPSPTGVVETVTGTVTVIGSPPTSVAVVVPVIVAVPSATAVTVTVPVRASVVAGATVATAVSLLSQVTSVLAAPRTSSVYSMACVALGAIARGPVGSTVRPTATGSSETTISTVTVVGSPAASVAVVVP